MAASSRPELEAAIGAQVAALKGLTVDELRAAWRSHFDAPPPPVRSRDLLRRGLAERLQLQAFGGDSDVDRRLAVMVRAYRRGAPPSPAKARFKAGAVLIREHAGVRHRVDVLADGFAWNGQTYASLSAIARQITGVRWNGPKFFGLREVERS